MQKIMFNDKFGLTSLVLLGNKQQTRRVIKGLKKGVFRCFNPHTNWAEFSGVHQITVIAPLYCIGEEVAVAMSYNMVYKQAKMSRKVTSDLLGSMKEKFKGTKGWNNKMFVKAKEMLYTIKITNIRVEIEVPEGYKAVYDDETQRIEIRKVEKELPDSWEDFCVNFPRTGKEVFISNTCEIISVPRFKDYISSELINVLPNKETAEAFLALMQLIQLRDCYRQGWKPDWNKDTTKHNIAYFGGNIYEDCSFECQHVLSFQSAKIRDEFRKNFGDLIEKAKELI